MLVLRICTTPGGSGLNPAYVSRHFDQFDHQDGSPAIRGHDLRHISAEFAGSEFLRSSADVWSPVFGPGRPQPVHAKLDPVRFTDFGRRWDDSGTARPWAVCVTEVKISLSADLRMV
jgi:hypothetical protein